MKKDTAGNQIIEPIQNCDCGLTGGCEKCRPESMGLKNTKGLDNQAYRVIWYRGNCDADEIIGYYNHITKAEIARKEYMLAHNIIKGKPCCSNPDRIQIEEIQIL